MNHDLITSYKAAIRTGARTFHHNLHVCRKLLHKRNATFFLAELEMLGDDICFPESSFIVKNEIQDPRSLGRELEPVAFVRISHIG